MRIAIISDVHSNIDALDGAIQDIRSKGIERILSTGDLVGYLAFPNEVVETIQREGIESIQGNHDLAIVTATMPSEAKILEMSEERRQGSASRLFTLKTISEDNVAYLKALPKTMKLEVEGVSIQLVHGSLNRVDEYIYESDDLNIVAAQMTTDLLVFGHTHIPFHQQIKGRHLVNAGSVGKPKHGASKGTYVVLSVDKGTVSVEICEFSYNLKSITQKIKKEPLISDQLIEALEEGK